MSQTLSQMLQSPPEGEKLAHVEKLLKQLTKPEPEALAALTACRWYKYVTHSNGILAVFQFSDTRGREEALWTDLRVIGATEAAEVTRAMYTEIGMSWQEMARGLPLALEASDRLRIASLAHQDETSRARADLPGHLWAYLRHHEALVAAVDALPEHKGLIARLFGL